MDRYTVTARFFPMAIFYFPVVLIAILYSFHFDKYSHLVTSLGVVAALSFFTAQIGRKGGKRKQKALWASWGGSPSTQLLRWRDNTIDAHTKKRYHLKLQALCKVEPFPSEQLEAKDPLAADQAYQAWVNYLIAHTRDSKTYSLLLKENINYGFWRNLWALKPYAIGLILILIMATFAYYFLVTGSFNPVKFPAAFFITESILLVLVLVWVFVVQAKDVKIPAFEYARRLLETTELLSSST